MVDKLTEKFGLIISKLGGKRKLTKNHISEGIREIRLALIEADVSLEVIKWFIAEVEKRALGREVIESVKPGEMFIKIVHDSLVAAFGGSNIPELNLAPPTSLTTVLMCGLQGSGKTTTCGKLASRFKDKRDIVLVSLDIYRPAANEQLKVVAESAGVDFYDRGDQTKIRTIIKDVQKYARKNVKNMIIFDTAGRTQLDSEMLSELKDVYSRVKPTESVLVSDSMTGQKALGVAREFKKTVPLSSLIFTKFDSDTKGGAVLSVGQVVGAPAKYVGTGEKIGDLEVFSPPRIAERILGKGDIVGLVEKAQQSIDEKKADRLSQKMGKKTFNLQDFYDQIDQILNMGSLESLMAMIPGMNKMTRGMDLDDGQFKKIKVVIQSMTYEEREKPFMINNRRKQRIARGSGTSILSVNQTMKKYKDMQKMMKKMKSPAKMMQMMEQMTGGELNTADMDKTFKDFPGSGELPGTGLPDMGGKNGFPGFPGSGSGFPGFPGFGKK